LFFNLIFSDPGTITSSNVHFHLKKYPLDEIVYKRPSMCKSCKIPRPPRSKHCRVCKRCVARFDHHCQWLNNDIGAKNLWKFLLFLLLTAMLCTYCSYLCFDVFREYILDQKLFDKSYVNSSGKEGKINHFIIIQYMLHHNPSLFSLMIFTIFVSLVLYSFTIHQCFLVSQNITSNETFKWQDLKDFIKQNRGEVSLSDIQKYVESRMTPLQPEDEVDLTKISHLYVKRREKQVEPVTKSNLLNIYDKGILMNILQLFNYNHK